MIAVAFEIVQVNLRHWPAVGRCIADRRAVWSSLGQPGPDVGVSPSQFVTHGLTLAAALFFYLTLRHLTRMCIGA
jgi:hypothetical protein